MNIHVSIARKLLMGEIKVKRSLQQKVEQRACAGICIIDNCGEPMTKRGLCARHRNKYYNTLRGLTAEQQISFEENCIRDGLILPVQAMRKYRQNDDNPFAKHAG